MYENREWLKATASNTQGCIELRDRGVDLRDSKDPSGPVLNFTRYELAAFVDGARRGEFDHLFGDARLSRVG
jgi:hypothetical protein